MPNRTKPAERAILGANQNESQLPEPPANCTVAALRIVSQTAPECRALALRALEQRRWPGESLHDWHQRHGLPSPKAARRQT